MEGGYNYFVDDTNSVLDLRPQLLFSFGNRSIVREGNSVTGVIVTKGRGRSISETKQLKRRFLRDNEERVGK